MNPPARFIAFQHHCACQNTWLCVIGALRGQVKCSCLAPVNRSFSHLKLCEQLSPSTSVHTSARPWQPVSELTFLSNEMSLPFVSCPFLQLNIYDLSFTGTFGRIFHGVLLDEKDPSKEKQVFVKTVKGMH